MHGYNLIFRSFGPEHCSIATARHEKDEQPDRQVVNKPTAQTGSSRQGFNFLLQCQMFLWIYVRARTWLDGVWNMWLYICACSKLQRGSILARLSGQELLVLRVLSSFICLNKTLRHICCESNIDPKSESELILSSRLCCIFNGPVGCFLPKCTVGVVVNFSPFVFMHIVLCLCLFIKTELFIFCTDDSTRRFSCPSNCIFTLYMEKMNGLLFPEPGESEIATSHLFLLYLEVKPIVSALKKHQ